MDKLRILTVDDHEMSMLGYKYILERIDFNGTSIQLDTATSFDEGKEKIDLSLSGFAYDIIFLDVMLATYEEPDAKNGEDLGAYARLKSPESKIVFMSSFSDGYRVNSILSNLDPEGYLVKSDINKESLTTMVHTVMTSPPFYSKGTLATIRKRLANDLPLDQLDKDIMHLLSLGVKTKDMTKTIPLSLAGIESRKRHIKSLFDIDKQNDQALLHEAKQRGFI